jgi:hypothetical protein
MKVFCIIALSISGVPAGLCLLALPLWLMGVPGVDNAYAKGWKIGLFAVLLYPIAWLCVFAFWLIVRKQISAEHLSVLNLSVGAGSLAVLAVASGVVFYAFKVMSRA